MRVDLPDRKESNDRLNDTLRSANAVKHKHRRSPGTRISRFGREGLVERLFTHSGSIAEYVETEKELAIVRELGFDGVQGHLIGVPEELA